MNLIDNIPNIAGFEEALKHFAEAGTLVDIHLRTFPTGYDVPKEVQEHTQTIRIIHVSKGCIVVGPKKPLVSSVIPIEEIAMVSISAKSHRTDEDELDKRIEEECPDWERDFAKKMEATLLGRRMVGDTDTTQPKEEPSQLTEIQNARFVVLGVFAPWCQPCKEVDTILEELEEKFGEQVLFVKHDGDKHDDAAEDLDINAYPTVILFEEGQVKKKIEGARSIEYYTNEIEILLGLKERSKKKNLRANGKVNVLPTDDLIEVIQDTPAAVIMFYERGTTNVNSRVES